MPDISMCQPTFCILKEKCYRYKANPSRYQNYSNFEHNMDDGTCDFFYSIDENEQF